MTTTPEKYTNENGMEFYKNVLPETPMSSLEFYTVDWLSMERYDQAVPCPLALNTNLGTFTVLTRMTGYGWLDVESGYRDNEGKFWLAAGHRDVRTLTGATIRETIDWVKANANICKGV